MAFASQANEVVVAHVGPFSGPLSGNGLANYDGGKACVDETNAAGGVHGRRIKLVREDDQYKPEETIRLLRLVAQRDKPVAFINLLGSANVTALIKDQTLEQLRIPAVGVTPGADALRAPGNTWMFHVHASDNAQLKRILTHLSTIGITRVAVVYQDIPFGKGGMKYIDELAASLKVNVTGRVAVPSAQDDLKSAAAELRASNAQAYIMILVPNSGTSMVRDVRGSGDLTPVYGMSYVPVSGIVEKTGAANAVGVGLAQVTPNASSTSTGLVRRFHAAMDKFGGPGAGKTQLHLVGYLSCRVLVEGLAAAGKDPTPERLKAAMQRVRAELGGYFVDFAESTVGSRFVEIGVVTREGKLTY